MMVENQPERRIGNGHRLTLPIMTRRHIKSTSEQPVHSVQPLSLSAPSGSGRLPALLQRVPDDDQQSVFEPSPPGTWRKDERTPQRVSNYAYACCRIYRVARLIRSKPTVKQVLAAIRMVCLPFLVRTQFAELIVR
jgi:hypothetical protein